jgi:prophage regulatory protein
MRWDFIVSKRRTAKGRCWALMGSRRLNTTLPHLPPLSQNLNFVRGAPQQCNEDQTMTDSPDRIIRLKTVLERTGLSRSTLYRKVQNGTFPRNIQISTRCTGWRASAVSDWLQNPAAYDVSSQRTE